MTKPDARPGPVVGLFLVACVVALPLLVLLQGLTRLDPDVLRLTVLVTAVATAVVALRWRRRLPRPPVTTSPRRALGIGLGLLVLVVVAHLVLAALAGDPWGRLETSTLSAPLVAVLAIQVLGAAAEEVGWRGVVQPALETTWTPLAAVAVTGLLFGLGHLYVAAAGLAAFGVFLVGAVALSLVLGAATVGASLGVRVAVATAVHWAVNAFTLVWFGDGAETLTWLFVTSGALVVAAVPAVVVLLRGPRVSSA